MDDGTGFECGWGDVEGEKFVKFIKLFLVKILTKKILKIIGRFELKSTKSK